LPEAKELIQRYEEVYQLHRARLEKEYLGKVVALYEDGVASITDTIDDALVKAEEKYPNKVFYVRKIGRSWFFTMFHQL